MANCGKQHASSAPRVSRWRGACRVAAAGGRGGRRAAGVFAARSRLSRSRVSLSVSRLDSGTVAIDSGTRHTRQSLASQATHRANFSFFRQYSRFRPECDLGVYTAPRSVLLPTTLITKVGIHHVHLGQRLRQLTASLRPHSRPPGAVTRLLSRVGPRLKHAVIPVTRAGVALHMADFKCAEVGARALTRLCVKS